MLKRHRANSQPVREAGIFLESRFNEAQRNTGEPTTGPDGAGDFSAVDDNGFEWSCAVIWNGSELLCMNEVVCLDAPYEALSDVRGDIHEAIERVLEQESEQST